VTSREWKYGDGSTPGYFNTIVNPAHKYLSAKTYQAKLIVVNSLGCKDSITKPVIVNKLPQAAFSNSMPCQRYDVEFTDKSVKGDTLLDSWTWDFGDPLNPYETGVTKDVAYRYDSSGTYDVSLIVKDFYGCVDNIVQPVTIVPSPMAAFTITGDIDGMQGKIKLNNGSSLDSKGFKWDFGNGKTSTEKNPVVKYDFDTQAYTIQLVAWNDGICYDTTYLTYEFMFDNLYVPNAFSPSNLSGSMGCRVFQPKGLNLQQYHVMVFDKWGHLLWESTKLTPDTGMPVELWDGTFNGEPMPQDVYMWKINATFKNGKVWEGSDAGTGSTTTMGTVTLIR
jgi:gliding motility-associated-like protein